MPAKIYKSFLGFTTIRTLLRKNLVIAQRGFTMIELLIVIAVLGILAVAVLSAINPIEQINRSRDTGSRSDAEQLISALDRFYANNGYYAWQTGASDPATTQAWFKVDKTNWKDSGGVNTVLGKLSQTGTAELKSSFVDRVSATTYNFLYVYNNGQQGSSTYLCFLPKSASFKTDATNRCTGTLPADFPTASACPGGTPPVYYSCLP